MPKIRKFVKNHKYEIMLLSVGAVVGAKYTRRKCEAHEEALVDEINRQLGSLFAQHKGNFVTSDGGYRTPVWSKL